MNVKLAAAGAALAAPLLILAGCSGQDTAAPASPSAPAAESPSDQSPPPLTIADVPPPTGPGVELLTESQLAALTDMLGAAPSLDGAPEFAVLFAAADQPGQNPGSGYALRTLIASSALAGYQIDGWTAVTVGDTMNPQKDDVTVSPGLVGNTWQAGLATPTSTRCVALPTEPGGPVTVTEGACPAGSEQAALETLAVIAQSAYPDQSLQSPPAGQETPPAQNQPAPQ